MDVVGITEAILLLGALVGGLAARQRKVELEKLNEQLRKINVQLRQQARAGTIYAPGGDTLQSLPGSRHRCHNVRLMTHSLLGSSGLTYAPPASGGDSNGVPRGLATLPLPPVASASAPAKSDPRTLLSMEDEEMSPDQIACRYGFSSGSHCLMSKQLECSRLLLLITETR